MTGRYVARGVYQVTWSGLKSGASVGPWTQLPHLPDRTGVISGTWGPGATVIVEGTNVLVSALTSGTAAFTLNDSRGVGNPLSFSTGKAFVILENVNALRPRVTALTSTVTPTLTLNLIAESRLR